MSVQSLPGRPLPVERLDRPQSGAASRSPRKLNTRPGRRLGARFLPACLASLAGGGAASQLGERPGPGEAANRSTGDLELRLEVFRSCWAPLLGATAQREKLRP